MSNEYGPPDDREILTADTQLTDRGVEAARHLSEVLDEKGAGSARMVARESYGWKSLGHGVARHVYETAETGLQQQIAFDPGDPLLEDDPYMTGSTPSVIKIATPNHGQTSTEIAQWNQISGDRYYGDSLPPAGADGFWGDLRPYIAPISDYDGSEYRWLVMRKLDPEPPADKPSVGGSLGREILQQTGWQSSDLHDDNVAYHNGDAYVIDYGHEFQWSGWTEAERIDAFEDALEQAGCRGVYFYRMNRGSRWEWGHPERLPGRPYEVLASELRATQGGRTVNLKLRGPVIPDAGATRIEVEDALDEVLDTPDTLRGVTTDVQGVSDGWLPVVKATYAFGQGPPLSETERFITAYYDQFDTIMPPLVSEYVEASDPDPPELDEEQTILQDIIEDFESLP